ncbi:acrEF/envCD operon transcriptional regulator [Superficieibacter electus]|uniref:AcrEF/envCD operon transcriptional regulator n=1 Tax=Superficieibacter electus TaxID=2022662 RepID=A0A2P5GQ44_9ENTR|nr:acrEF/envCD operon transcriptional regulator [Superficieibacter electus]POP45499.1 acrEF/envCD operon transcriptional regulator [Superficieibacter electus]POP48660.1 acrEF/envCD operon transcriptional regulator [Superficieibacter electus]
MARKTKAEALKTRQMLIESAIEQFAQHGVANTTLTDIADAAGVTRGAVYWHFNSKIDIFNAIWEQQAPLRDIIYHQTKEDIHLSPLLHLRNQFVIALQYIAADSRLRALMQILYHRCEFIDEMMPEDEIRKKIGFSHEHVRAVLKEAVTSGSLPTEVDLNVVLIMLHGFFSGVIKNWLMAPEKFDLYQHAPTLVDNIMLAVTAKPGQILREASVAC